MGKKQTKPKTQEDFKKLAKKWGKVAEKWQQKALNEECKSKRAQTQEERNAFLKKARAFNEKRKKALGFQEKALQEAEKRARLPPEKKEEKEDQIKIYILQEQDFVNDLYKIRNKELGANDTAIRELGSIDFQFRKKPSKSKQNQLLREKEIIQIEKNRSNEVFKITENYIQNSPFRVQFEPKNRENEIRRLENRLRQMSFKQVHKKFVFKANERNLLLLEIDIINLRSEIDIAELRSQWKRDDLRFATTDKRQKELAGQIGRAEKRIRAKKRDSRRLSARKNQFLENLGALRKAGI